MNRAFAGIFVGVLLAACGSDLSTSNGSSPATAENTTSASAAAPAHAQQILLDVPGSGIKTTNRFTAAGDWDLNWSYDCSAFPGGSGPFAVLIYGKDSTDLKNLGANETGAKGQDVSHQHDTGSFYLQVASTCTWHVVVKG